MAMVDVIWLAETGPCRKYKGGERIPCPGGPAAEDRAMYILLTGRADVYKASAAGGMQLTGTLLPGDVFGGREYFTDADDCVYTAGVDTVVYVVTEESFRDLSWSRPDILFEALKAAYMPLRKLTASQKTALGAATASPDTASQPSLAASSAQPTSSQAGAPTAHAPAGSAPHGNASAGPVPVTAAALASLANGGIFPEGHKPYPGNAKPEHSKLIFAKEYTCPNCKKPFSDYKVFRSKLYESSPIRYDLRRFYTDFQTEWYDVIICHNCLFATFHNYFTEPKPMRKELIEGKLGAARSSIHVDFDAARDINYVFTGHYLAILCSEAYLSAGKSIRAKLWGNLSWLYEDVGDKEMEKFAAGKAAEAYEIVYTETRLLPAQEQGTCLSIAGMQYRAGMDKNLKKFLFTAKTMKNADKTLAKLAEDFMYEISDES